MRNILRVGLIAILVCIVLGTTMATATVCTPLKITSYNLAKLNGFDGNFMAYHSGGYLSWAYAGQYLQANYKRSYGSDCTQFADNGGNYWGECVSAVKALSGSTATTSQWGKGSQVTVGGIPQGTVIATFPNGGYYGHAAIFKGYVYNNNGIMTDIEVWDQNWVTPGTSEPSGLFRKHTLSCTSSGYYSNANNYYVVIAPV